MNTAVKPQPPNLTPKAALINNFKANSANEKGIEKRFSQFLFYVTLYLPGTMIKLRKERAEEEKQGIVEWYVIGKLVLAVLSCCILPYLPFWPKMILFWVLVILTLETICYNLFYILCRKILKKPASYKRVIILCFLNYLEIVFNFSYFYAARSLIRLENATEAGAKLSGLDHLFFSISTGGILNGTDYTLHSAEGKLLAMIQGILLLMYFGLFVSYNIGLFSNE